MITTIQVLINIAAIGAGVYALYKLTKELEKKDVLCSIMKREIKQHFDFIGDQIKEYTKLKEYDNIDQVAITFTSEEILVLIEMKENAEELKAIDLLVLKRRISQLTLSHLESSAAVRIM